MMNLMDSDSMDFDEYHCSMDNIYSDDEQKCYEAIITIKNFVIGSNKQKENIIESGIVPRLVNLLEDSSNEKLHYEIVATICSLSKGNENNIRLIIDAKAMPVFIKIITENKHDTNLLDICLKTLRSLYKSNIAPIQLIYGGDSYQILEQFITLLNETNNWSSQECIITILAQCCQVTEHQNIISNFGIIQILGNLLEKSVYKVKIPSLHLLAQLSYQNEKVSSLMVSTHCENKELLDILVEKMHQENSNEMQIAAGKCMTNIYRSGALDSKDYRICFKTLSTLTRLCKRDCEPLVRASAAETLAYLTEIDTDLQKTASICNHIILTVAEFFKPQCVSVSFAGFDSNLSYNSFYLNGTIISFDETVSSTCKRIEKDHHLLQTMKIAAFKLYASLSANDEEIRKKIIETDILMEQIINGLSDNNMKVKLAALQCLHSLSRSVQQLRTTFQDHAVWVPLRNLLNSATDDVLTIASSTLCNLLLEFSPSKQHFLDRGAVDLLCNLTKRDEPTLRLNGVWALMNMAFQAEQTIKLQILSSLGIDQIFNLLEESDPNILIKTLGLIRNLLSTKLHIDHIMNLHGRRIMEAINLIFEGDYTPDVKEQALCVLANIADGVTAKDFIMSNEEILKKVINYLMNSNLELKKAAVICITNLIWKEEEGSLARQSKFKEMGVQKILQNLLTTPDTTLFDKVKTASQQFQSG